MDPLPEDVLEEFQSILCDAQEEFSGEETNSLVASLPKTNVDFQTCRLRNLLFQRLEARLGEAVDQELSSTERLSFADKSYVSATAVDEVVARLASSEPFDHVVNDARPALQRAAASSTSSTFAAGAQTADSDAGPVSSAGPVVTASGSEQHQGGFLHRRSDVFDSDMETELTQARRKAARTDDWVGIFDLCGGGIGGGFSPRVDIEASLTQLEEGLNSSPSASGAVDALESLAEADLELFQFGDHWSPFLDLARRALESTDPRIHAKAMTTHWVMYEKAMGMSAADLCENVLDHTRRYFAEAIHVVTASTAGPRPTTSEREGVTAIGEGQANLMIVADSELACVGRKARAIHGIMTTIHEVFQHIPERRVWKIVSSFLALVGDASAASSKEHGGGTTSSGGTVGDVVLRSAHFLANAGRVEDWLPAWLTALPTGRLMRAFDDAGIVSAMIRRCEKSGRVSLKQSESSIKRPCGPDPAVVSSAAVPIDGVNKTIHHHRLSVGAGCSGAFPGTGTVPLGRAMWLSLIELERALLMQAISFLGAVAIHCRGNLQPCSLGEAASTSQSEASPAEGEVKPPPVEPRKIKGDEKEQRVGLEAGKSIAGALVRCVLVARIEPYLSLPRAASASSRQASCVARPPVWRVALNMVARLARASAGAISSPFSPAVIDSFLSLLESERRTDSGQVESSHSRPSSGRSKLDKEMPEILGKVSEVSSVLLSSRGTLAGFFVQGDAGPEPSRALDRLVRCTVELTKHACSHEALAQREKDAETTQHKKEGTGRGDSGLSSMGRDDVNRLAVDFACTLARISGLPPKERAAGWTAVWQHNVPRAIAALAKHLGSEETRNGRGSDSRDSCFYERLDYRLFSSLVEWAHDLTGIGLLRSAGLMDPCASFLSRELARQHLDPSTRSECPDLRPLSLASRLALFPEGFNALLRVEGGIADEVDEGLSRLGESTSLAGLLQPQSADASLSMLPASSTPGSVNGTGGARGVGGGPREGRNGLVKIVGQEWMGGVGMGNDTTVLRCLEFVRHISLSAPAFPTEDFAASCGALRVERWMRWVGFRLASEDAYPGAIAVLSDDEAAGEELDDVRVAALHLATDLATDITQAVGMEARWSLLASFEERNAREKAMRGGASTAPSTATDGDGTKSVDEASRRWATTRSDPGYAASRHEIVFERQSSTFDAPPILEPATLARARLAVSLAFLGGPTEERQLRLQSLDAAEMSAAGLSGIDPGYRSRCSAGNVAPPKDSFAREAEAEAGVKIPDDKLSDVDWWDRAGKQVSMVVTSLAESRQGPRAAEAFTLLQKAAARKSLLLPNHTTSSTEMSRTPMTRDRYVDGEHRSISVAKDDSDRATTVVERLCFTYACGLGLVNDAPRDSFGSGLRVLCEAARGTAAATAAAVALASNRAQCKDAAATATPSTAGCDWFSAVTFLVSGTDSAAASELMRSMQQDPFKAVYIMPLAGARFAAAAKVASSSSPSWGGVDSDGDETMSRVESELSHTLNCRCRGATGETVASLHRGDPPLLLLAALVESILDEELPNLSTALRAMGWSAAPLALRWMKQCMLCVVDWSGVVAYLALALLRGHDYQVYFVVSLFRCAEPLVLEAAAKGSDLTGLLCRGEAIAGFDLERAIAFMEELEKRHRPHCLAATQAYLASSCAQR